MQHAVVRHGHCAGHLQLNTARLFAIRSRRTISSNTARSSVSPFSKAKATARLPSGQRVKIFSPSVGLRGSVVSNSPEQAAAMKAVVRDLKPAPVERLEDQTESTKMVVKDAKPAEVDIPKEQTIVNTPAPMPTLVSKPRPTVPILDGAAALAHMQNSREFREAKASNRPQTLFSITLLWLLRHGARSLGYTIVPDGFVRVSDVLRFDYFKHLTTERFAQLCTNDPTHRFEVIALPDLVEDKLQDVWWVRARSGQTIPGVLSSNKRVLNMGKLQTVIYRTTVDEWEDIQKYGIREGPDYTIPLLAKSNNFFHNIIPRHKTFLCITIDAAKAAGMGVMFFHTNEVELFGIGNRDHVIPTETFRSVIELEISKKLLTR